ncbi:hypothetical protein Taro_000324 [Colocasia esculenta]|uniref:Uncharacterized protein n=1 Tax=Colocasia esculenta TaxID=4460 RepID=A0A843TH50_COLES|nr:hypothetical protein [Colocasia esculenta]
MKGREIPSGVAIYGVGGDPVPVIYTVSVICTVFTPSPSFAPDFFAYFPLFILFLSLFSLNFHNLSLHCYHMGKRETGSGQREGDCSLPPPSLLPSEQERGGGRRSSSSSFSSASRTGNRGAAVFFLHLFFCQQDRKQGPGPPLLPLLAVAKGRAAVKGASRWRFQRLCEQGKLLHRGLLLPPPLLIIYSTTSVIEGGRGNRVGDEVRRGEAPLRRLVSARFAEAFASVAFTLASCALGA